ncbi:MAG: DUF192 domain-containing protein [Candidatus Micrarchaeia archaeon]|jgi:uncharacterized membrane protein (UPF0127 family)
MAAHARVLRSTNSPAKAVVLRNFERADTPMKRFLGIMFRKKISRPLLFKFQAEARFANSIHSFFCLVPFDAVFLDSKKRVVDVVEAIPPFRLLIVPKAPALYLVEGPAGFAKATGLRKGVVLRFEG